VPTGVKIFNWLGTVYGGAVKLTTAMLFSLGFIAMFTLGGLSGVLHSVVPSDTQQTDTYFVVAHFHYVLFGGLMLGVFSGFYYWWPKMFGRMLDERLGKINFWTLLIGFNLTFFPMHIVGLLGMPRRTYRYDDGMGWDALNMIETVGGFVVALGTLVFLVNMIVTARKPRNAPADPWDGRSLEWSVPSPTPEYNFADIPRIEARDDWWHRKYTEDSEGRLVKLPTGGAVDEADLDVHQVEEEHHIHLPSPSFYPFVVALGLPVLGYAAVFLNVWLVIPGLLLVLFGIYAWGLEPGTEPEPVVAVPDTEAVHA